jgi:tetratricopeptide (TPR) repeat protein
LVAATESAEGVGCRVRVFISHAGRDQGWAEWIAWQLDRAGVGVELDCWDWQAGEQFVGKMNTALTRADVMLAVFSEAYFEPQRWTSEEWQAAVGVAKQRPGFLVPVRIDDAPAPPLLAGLIAAGLHGRSAQAARQTVLAAVRPEGRPGVEPAFPGESEGAGVGEGAGEPRFPGVLPPVWGRVPMRNATFTGRDGMLARLRADLGGSRRSKVHALHGAGGVGKTQLAGEFAWRFAGDYDAVWWVAAEQPDLIGQQYAAFAVALNLVDPTAPVAAAVAELGRWCRGRGRWLVVLDNAATAADIQSWLLTGPGHTVVTSRDPAAWPQIATSVAVDVFDRAESIALLHTHLPTLPTQVADRVAKAVGDLPLGLAQAAGVLAEGLEPEIYLDLLANQAGEVLAAGRPLSYPVPLAAAVRVAADQLAAVEPAALQLLRVCAVMAPEPIPVAWFTGLAEGVLPQPLAGLAGSPLALHRVVAMLARYGAARVERDPARLVVHRLTQAVIAESTPIAARAALTATVTAMLTTHTPDNIGDPMTWPAWAAALPHLRTLDLAGTADRDLARTADQAIRYLLCLGDLRAAHELAASLHDTWSTRLGDSHQHTRWAATCLTFVLQTSGRYRESRKLTQRLYDHYRAELGDDHPDTLSAAANLAGDLNALGEHQQARALDEDTLTRHQRVLGDDHPDTFWSATNLAADLRALGEHEQARALDEDTLTRRRRVLGDDHPGTLWSALNLAADLRGLGEHQQARALDEETLTSYRRVLGDDHPDTFWSATNLAADLRALGEHEKARALDEDTLTRYRRVRGDDHPDTLTLATNLAADLTALGEHKQADRWRAWVEDKRAGAGD